MDLTVAAIPMYFGGMAAEARALRRRAARRGPSAADYTRPDTVASLTMGTISLLAPLAVRPLVQKIRPRRGPDGRSGRIALGLVAGTALATQIADVVRRRTRSARVERLARTVSEVGGPITIAGTTTIAAATISGTITTHSSFRHRLLPDLGQGPAAWAVAILGWDFVYYWNHRFMHEWRHMWAIHVVHHSSEHYNLSTALRQAWADSFGTFVPYALGFVGVRPELVIQARGVNLLYQFWIHTDLVARLGPFERVLNTPSHHRVHHGSNSDYLDRNYGSILIIWDRLFGTFQAEHDGDPVVYGLTKNIDSFNPLTIGSHEFVDILRDVAHSESWGDRFRFAWSSPGWAIERRRELMVSGGPATTV